VLIHRKYVEPKESLLRVEVILLAKVLNGLRDLVEWVAPSVAQEVGGGLHMLCRGL
jgi:hypothetical protein